MIKRVKADWFVDKKVIPPVGIKPRNCDFGQKVVILTISGHF